MLVVLEILLAMATAILALVAYFSRDWLTFTTRIVTMYLGLQEASFEYTVFGQGENRVLTNWCDSIDTVNSILNSDAEDTGSYCSILNNEIEPSMIIGVSLVLVGCLASILTYKMEDTYAKTSGIILAYVASFLCFVVAAGRWDVIKSSICGDLGEEVCANSTDYYLLVGTVVLTLLLALGHGVSLLNKMCGLVSFGKPHTTSVPNADRRAHPRNGSGSTNQGQTIINAQV